ncbi:non-heme iron oxygenase ferredoxin subunit [Alicyclobacillus tolerans]|uniref:3-phenylpropionate/trans-cinnamate dioxygenase ferredoxin subunit n=1 Tax=Alicyclobacillus tolerans TaxID=90970 RepID=A0A1M6L4R9_9BACL|nr:non-heme iron oxygenase ferredoxin subunit [Alicyclobacillus montanus]SHJ66192.1 3-phenylpropionate/trans-cinnamate dioxygenase ferredoxin subunit [Alicyclobacillus montanus]
MGWVKIAQLSEIPVGQMLHVEVGMEDIGLFHTEDGLFATSDVCTHAAQQLTNGRLEGNIVSCPKHGGKFDVRTGEATAFPCYIPLQTYQTEVRGEEVWIHLD